LKHDYFWFAYFFILIQGPGYFFSDYSGAAMHRLPMYSLLPGMSVTPIDIFVVVALVKSLVKGKRIKFKLQKPLLVLLIYAILSVIVSALLFGTDIDTFTWNMRWLFYYTLIISFVYLVYRKDHLYRFIILVCPFVFLILFTQIYFVVTGGELINLFSPGFRGVTLNALTGQLRPVSSGILLVLFCFIFSLFMLSQKKQVLLKIFLHVVVVTAFLSVFLSATRVWFVVFSFILAAYLLISRKKVTSVVVLTSFALVAVSTLTYLGLVPEGFMVESAWGRVRQIFDVAGGNIAMVGTARNRFVNQLPIILGIIKQNPLIGYGFTDVMMRYYDNDFGFLNTILMFGLIGFSLLVLFFIKTFTILVQSVKRVSISSPLKLQLKVLVIAWAGILIAYFTTWDFFTRYSHKVFFVAILVAFSEILVRQTQEEESIFESRREVRA
jgi:hypothetical protein